MSDALPVVPVLFGSDRKYLQHAAACIASLADNNPEFHFDILVVGAEDLTPLADKFLSSFAERTNVGVRIIRFELPSDMTFPLHFHYTLETYIRFWIGEFFPGYGRALYIDPDTIVTGSIAELWSVDLKGKTVAAVPIPGSTRPEQHGLPAGSLYFNAGMLIFDLNAWRERNYQDICLRYLNDHPEKAIDSDQDILNLCLADDWLPLPFRWNVISAFYFPWHDLKLSEAEIGAVHRDARIIHFNGGTKPWSYLSKHPRKAEYWKYLRRTAWRDCKASDRTPINVAKAVARMVLRPFGG